jgi:hypothetical protein
VTSLLHALAHLARLRWLGAAFCALAILGVTTQVDCPHGLCASPAYGGNIQALDQMRVVDTSGTWETIFDIVTLPAPIPGVGALKGATTFGRASVGAAERGLGRALQTGGHTIKPGTAKALNEALGFSFHPREWGHT